MLMPCSNCPGLSTVNQDESCRTGIEPQRHHGIACQAGKHSGAELGGTGTKRSSIGERSGVLIEHRTPCGEIPTGVIVLCP